ncbi:NAD(P)/FAD-dependent oxidoreductase [Spiribacter halobius]|uniref:Gamma-glutamylputrescine oxidoreductase n=1 Tax=Sediminicurvatus halobius TaxID=2182432 RepID=A0A2U2N1P0_9GAMM|nr:FAD-binding oxidoreductase [Spiribacter halobius]PWG63096.1 gamma-glutamylputrescine oxidoreductase [Spiribacter halobius]UEX77546.1 FAD-binding oxidoreductase [Spiribacter halobius]
MSSTPHSQHAPSYYAATCNDSRYRPPLEGSTESDVCVVGAGFSGLATALHLAERGYRVVVLEAQRIAWGASGRNGGQLVNGYSRDLDVIERRYGRDAADALGGMAFEGGGIIREWIDRYGIDCDYREGGVAAALNRRQLAELEAMVPGWERHGHSGLELLDERTIRDHVNTDLYVGGLLDRWGGHVHPLNLALGEAAAIEGLGGRLFEDSPVVRVTGGERPEVLTGQGAVRADHIVLCGNAYLGATVPALRDKVMPVSTQVIATEPLGEATVRRLMPSGACVEDCNYMLDYYRMTADHRLLFGGGTVYGGREPGDIAARLRPHVRRTFPELGDVRFDYAWSGNFALTLTRIPHLGRLPDGVWFTHGYSGHGVTTTHLAGRLLAEAIDGETERFEAFARLRNIPFPGGRLLRVPLTAMGAWYYQLRDRLGL